VTSAAAGSGVPDLTFRHYDGRRALAVRGIVALIHRDAYADAIASGDPFESHDAFMRRFDGHTTHQAFDLVLALAGGEPVGQAWGWPEQATDTDRPASPAGETRIGPQDEDDNLVFGFAELMVRKAWTGRGVAHALHDELLSARTELRAELCVRPGSVHAYRAYRKWGWRKVGETRPGLQDAPVFDVLILPLPVKR